MVYAFYPNRRGLLQSLDPQPKDEHFYPQLDQLTPDFLNLSPRSTLHISKDTPIASIGSCFAREIRQWLINHNFNFIQTATGPGTGAGSARYDRVYSTFSIRQEFERAFGEFNPLVKYWEVNEEGKQHLVDPHRYTIAWDNHEERKQEQEEHRQAVLQAFTQAKVIIVTVGQGEVWYDVRDGSVFPILPPLEIFNPTIHKLKVSGFEENLENLRRCRDLLKEHNPYAHLIVTTSPVPLKVSFSGMNSIIANNAMKSMLRAVVDQFVKESDDQVHYFPAYELVTQLIPQPFTDDGRHVKRETVAVIMSCFEETFVKSKDVGNKSDLSLQELIALQNQVPWSKLATYRESLKIDPKLSDDYLQYLDLFGKAFLFSNRLEEGVGLLLEARKLHQQKPRLDSILSVITRNNLLLVSLADNDHDLRLDVARELIAQEYWPPSILINFLESISKRAPLKAIKIYTELADEEPKLNDINEVTEWLEETLKNLQN